MTKKVTLTVYTLTHFAVDLGCGWLIYALYNSGVFGIKFPNREKYFQKALDKRKKRVYNETVMRKPERIFVIWQQ